MMSEDLSGEIRLGRLRLKNFIILSDEERRLVLGWRNNEAVRKYVSTDPGEITFSDHQIFIERLKKRRDRYYFLVSDEQNPLGVVSLLEIDRYNRRCIWGDYANPEHFDTGAGIVLEYAALQLVFDRLTLHCLRCRTIEENRAALKLHKFFGFETEGTLREYLYRDNNRFYNVIVMSIMRERWAIERPRIERLIAPFL